MIRPCNICDMRVFTHRRTVSDEIIYINRHEKGIDEPKTQAICEVCINDMMAGKPTPEKIERAFRIYLLANGKLGETVPFDPNL